MRLLADNKITAAGENGVIVRVDRQAKRMRRRENEDGMLYAAKLEAVLLIDAQGLDETNDLR